MSGETRGWRLFAAALLMVAVTGCLGVPPSATAEPARPQAEAVHSEWPMSAAERSARPVFVPPKDNGESRITDSYPNGESWTVYGYTPSQTEGGSVFADAACAR